jgi:hypothetical protein
LSSSSSESHNLNISKNNSIEKNVELSNLNINWSSSNDNKVANSSAKSSPSKDKAHDLMKDKEVADSHSVTPNQIKIAERELISILGNERALKIYDQYQLGEYDPAYDETWQYDMESAIYADIDVSALRGQASVQKYQCTKASRCEANIIITSNSESRLQDINDYVLNLKSNPAIMKSGKKRDVYIKEIGQGEFGYELQLSIESK